ncbi:ADP-ribose pyrophosphatase YjhB (NUDIX family) [Scopulibacillus daqui]|uniref:ADP-ribose pyrophosphatase YjhB (NUDIX family) n=1 Tax=Scopulibacillus daqui TaxID=1469162 RepID=A0ABS2PWR1_9BACL|nr:NUDIX hydrolase [Scopulibacillus daqui]MBM7644503.1 ADP-ribose pyrophosphatase YjhB (NUDIX family) [Scopulibacillus daqui]
MEPKWLTWAKQLQSIAQAGLTYSKDVYDLERFELIRNISTEILSEYTDTDKTVIKDLFANETGYATPKVDIRAVVFRDNKILMVRENTDGEWSLPGGWGDIGLTPGEVAVKEVKEESGFDVRSVKLMGVCDKKCHPHPPSPYHVYKIFIQCEIIGGQPKEGLETSAVGFFEEHQLPPLSNARNTESQINWVFKHLHNPQEPVYFD